MEIRTYVILDRGEIQEQIPYALICETMEGAKWNTGKRRRLMKERFTKSEIKAIGRLHRQAHNWYLIRGVPNELELTTKTMILWRRLADLCCEL